MDERTALLALSLVPGVGSGRLHALLEAFEGSAVEAWRGRSLWHSVAKMPSSVVAKAATVTKETIDRELRRLDALQARIVTRSDPEYPPGLLHVAGPAPVLFVRGRLPLDYTNCVAIVGTRRPSRSGERTSTEIASQLAAVGLGIVSGLALGIDGAAHRGALRTGGTTVAVLGCGLDYCYPQQHAELMEEIAATGAVVTEYTLGTKPLPRHFPARNRLIAGLSAGVVLVESGGSGGALHTVEYALAAGREVMAVPGDVHRWQSFGPNQLLKDGAALVRNAADVLHVLGRTTWPTNFASGESATAGRESVATTEPAAGPERATVAGDDPRDLARLVVGLLQKEGALSADELQSYAGASASEVAATLTWLEVTGAVCRVPGGRFAAGQ